MQQKRTKGKGEERRGERRTGERREERRAKWHVCSGRLGGVSLLLWHPATLSGPVVIFCDWEYSQVLVNACEWVVNACEWGCDCCDYCDWSRVLVGDCEYSPANHSTSQGNQSKSQGNHKKSQGNHNNSQGNHNKSQGNPNNHNSSRITNSRRRRETKGWGRMAGRKFTKSS